MVERNMGSAVTRGTASVQAFKSVEQSVEDDALAIIKDGAACNFQKGGLGTNRETQGRHPADQPALKCCCGYGP
jgi:hypothetical protein